MIVPRMALDGSTNLDANRRSSIDGQMGSRQRSASESSNVDGILPSHHGPSNAVIPNDDGFVRRSVSMPLSNMVGGADADDVEMGVAPALEAWGMRGEVLRRQTLGASSVVPFALNVGDCRVNGRQLADPRQSHRVAPPITSLTIAHGGANVAYADHSGKLYVLGELPKSEVTRRAQAVGGAFSVQGDANRLNDQPWGVQQECRHRRYRAICGANAYSAVIDPLNSVAVTPAISAMGFVPRDGPSNLLITTNEKVPKLFKITDNYDSPQASFRAVDLMGTKMIGPLVSTSRTHTHSIKQVHRYGMDHEYNINSVSATMDGQYFYTSDEMCVRLWSVEHPDMSIEVVALPKGGGEDGEESAREAIISTRMFPQEPSLCFLSTSAGNVRVCDSRESLRWTNRLSHQVFTNPTRELYDGKYGTVTNAITGGCAMSPCGRYIAARDFFSVIMWDVRKASAPTVGGPSYADVDYSIVRRWELHPRLRHHMDSLYQSNLLFERFGIDFCTSVSSAQTGCIVTGGLGNTIFAMDPLSTADVVDEPIPDDVDSAVRAAEGSMKGLRAYVLPDPAAIAEEQGLEEPTNDAVPPALQQLRVDPYCHRVPSQSVPYLSHAEMTADREYETGRVAHVVDSGIDGGGVWVSAGEFLVQLTL